MQLSASTRSCLTARRQDHVGDVERRRLVWLVAGEGAQPDREGFALDPGALAARLEAGIPARTVLWLGELRQYADADGGADVLGRLADLIVGEGRLLITTVWPEQWTTYTAAARAGPGAADPAGVAGRLLTRLPELTGHDPTRIDPARGHRRPGPVYRS